MRLSIVTSLYRSAPYLVEFCRRAGAAARAITENYEILLVVDGSPDNSLEVALEIQRQDSHVTVLELSRNFGHHKALMTGLMHSTGDQVYMVDCDLEEQPEWLALFHEEMERRGADVVFGVQNRRKGGFFERITGGLFYRLFNLLSDTPVPADQVMARLMSKEYVRALVAHQESEMFLAGLCALTGFRQKACSVAKLSKGSTTYSLWRKLTQVVTAFTSFSDRPLWLICLLGLVIAATSLMGAATVAFRWLFCGDFLMGWPSLIVSIWFLGGLNLFAVGILGIYLSKVFIEIKRRPYTIIRRRYASTSLEPADQLPEPRKAA